MMIIPAQRRRTLEVDSRSGGFGDVWMRLHALYALASLVPEVQIKVALSPALFEIAEAAFSGRLSINRQPAAGALTFTHLGIRHIAMGLLRGTRFVNPFQSIIARDRRITDFKSRLNDAFFRLLAVTGRLVLTDVRTMERYHGWLQISGLPYARSCAPEHAMEQMIRDLPEVRARLRAVVPEKPGRDRVIFPGGTSFQIMPLAVALEHFPDAAFAFHANDGYQEDFRRAGLKVIHFETPLTMLATASQASRVMCTDSFPSHLLQTYSHRTVLALSHYPRRRIVHPGFDGVVVDSTAACCPCVTRARADGGRCPAGYAFCSTWNDQQYLATLSRAVQS
jgi:hypothetical protein